MGLSNLLKRVFGGFEKQIVQTKQETDETDIDCISPKKGSAHSVSNEQQLSTTRQHKSTANQTDDKPSFGGRNAGDKTQRLKSLLELLHEESSRNLTRLSVCDLFDRVSSLYGDLDDRIAVAAIEQLSLLVKGDVEEQDFDSFRVFIEKIYDPIRFDSAKLSTVKGCRFVLTGDFATDGGKDTLKKMIDAAGGKTTGSVSKSTDYVVAGSLGSGAWGLGNYGGKIKDAVVSHLEGNERPFILSEEELVSYLNTHSNDAVRIREEREALFEEQWRSAQVVSRSFKGLTDGQQKVFDLVGEGKNVYLTGLGGTGKSYVIEKIIQRAKQSNKNVIVCAPTGIAALNIGGTTIHRALGIRPDKTLEMNPYPVIPNGSAIPECDLMIVDEISMCRMDLFDYLSSVLRKAGAERQKAGRALCQLVVVGDFCQLAPVVRAADRKILEAKYGYKVNGGYPFMGKYWDSWSFEKVELTEAIRQRDSGFVAALNACRVGDPSGVRWIREHASKKKLDDAIFLCGKNEQANAENDARLNALPGKATSYRARVEGEVTNQDKPTADNLALKRGARVMALVNDSETTFMNGSLGTVASCEDDCVVVDFDELGVSTVGAHEWRITVPKLVDGKTENETIGIFKQIPLKLAWAITIHKAQGQTFDRANIDPDCWECGQLYTALSRMTEVGNMYIVGFMNDSFLKTSQDVIDFIQGTYEKPKPQINRDNSLDGLAGTGSREVTSDEPERKNTSGRHAWSADEEQFILDHPEMTLRELADIFGVTVKAVERRRAKLRRSSIGE